jgi:hypothetical protein
MKKTGITIALFLFLFVLAGCSGGTTPAAPSTDFGRMLGSVPASVLDEHHVWYENPGLAKEQAGFGQVNSIAAYQALSADDKTAFRAALSGVNLSSLLSQVTDKDTFGWDLMMVRRSVFAETPPPYGFTVNEGAFDASLVTGRLTDQGYTEADHAGVSYYAHGGDYEISMQGPFGGQVLAAFNRMMVADDTIITAPTTDLIDGILDTRAGNVESITDTPAGLALANDMGEVYAALFTTPDLVPLDFTSGNAPKFDLPASRAWVPLHEYALAGIGYRADGEDRYLDICVAYASKSDAEADAPLLAERLDTYVFNTEAPNTSMMFAFTDSYEISEPVLTTYGDATVVKISCRRLGTEGSTTVSLMQLGTLGDMLFLAPDPTPYLVD